MLQLKPKTKQIQFVQLSTVRLVLLFTPCDQDERKVLLEEFDKLQAEKETLQVELSTHCTGDPAAFAQRCKLECWTLLPLTWFYSQGPTGHAQRSVLPSHTSNAFESAPTAAVYWTECLTDLMSHAQREYQAEISQLLNLAELKEDYEDIEQTFLSLEKKPAPIAPVKVLPSRSHTQESACSNDSGPAASEVET